VLQSEAISPEERALPRFSRRGLKCLPTWDLWHKNELEQLVQMKALGMFGSPIKLPEGGILMRFHWQYRIKVNGKRRSRLCCDGSPRAAPEVHSTTYALCLEHPAFQLFIALCAADNLTIYGGDAKDAFAHSPGPSMPTFMKLDDVFRDWYLEHTGVLLDKDLVLPVLRTLQGHPEAARLWEEHISAILEKVEFNSTMHEKNIYTGQFCGEKVLLVRQVDDFALGCHQESTAKSVYAKIGAKLTLHNEAEAPFEHLGLVDSFHGYDVLQTCEYIKLSAASYIRRLLKAHGWDNPSPHESSNKPKPPLHESDVANLFNLAAGPVENTPKHKALEAEQGFGYRNVLGEILFAYVLCRPDIGYAVTTLAKFSTAPNALQYKSLKQKDVVEGTGNEGIIGEQDGNLSSLANSNTDRCQLIDEFYSHDGLMHFSDSEDEAKEKVEVETNKEETKVMTRSKYEKASIAPPPASKAPYPKDRRTHSLSPKPTSLKTTKTTSPPQTPKVTIIPQAATQIVKPRQGPKL